MARDRLFGLDASQWGGPVRPSHRAVVRALRKRPSMRDAAHNLEQLRRTREVADYVRDPLHPEAQDLFMKQGVSGWRELAQFSLLRARDVFAALQSMPTEA